MENNELSFDSFIENVDPKYHDFVQQKHAYLISLGCKLKLQLAKNGYVVSYQHGKKKRVLLNYVFRKSGLHARVYCDFISQYMDVLEEAPEDIRKVIVKAPSCKRFENPPKCNSKCSGYVFTINGTQHQKCRYNCFLLEINDASIPFINNLLENELKHRDLNAK